MTRPPTRRLALPERYDFAGTLRALSPGALVPGRLNPTIHLSPTHLWWASRTPEGPGTLHLTSDGVATGYGPGADWLLAQADGMAGLRDDIAPFEALMDNHPVVRRAARARPGLRMPRTGRVFQQVVPVILGQKVTGVEAARGYARLVRHFGQQAPGPVEGLLLPPDPARVAATPYWVFHPLGIEARRVDTVRRAAALADRLESVDLATTKARLTAIPGIGAWTVAETVRVSHGDPDAVSVGDYHIPHHVVYALTGVPRAGSRQAAPGQVSPADQRLLEVLAPFAGQRGRVCELLRASTPPPPRTAPRSPIRSFAHY